MKIVKEVFLFWMVFWSIVGPISFLAWTDFVHNWSGIKPRAIVQIGDEAHPNP